MQQTPGDACRRGRATQRDAQEEKTKTYRIANLKHRSGGSGFITAHNILDHDVASLFLRP